MELKKKALLLSYFTVAYNILEGIASVFVGLVSGSIALVGFGLDSFVESLSGMVMIWRFKDHSKMSKEEEEKIEKKAIKFVGYTFFILAIYITYESIKKLYFKEIPEPTLFGIIIAVASLIIMPFLFYMKNKIGKKINSKSLVADSKQTLICVFLSVVLLVGLTVNYLYGLWWFDPLAGLIIAVFLIKEGHNTLKEEKLCSC